MTREQLDAMKVLLPKPFASNDSSATNIPSTSSVDAPLNIQDGFGAKFDAPPSNGGKLVTRHDINGAFKLATSDASFRQCGGFYTFNQELCTKIGGYAKNAVLYFLDESGVMHFVRSLVDNNTYNFVLRGVDDVNWTYCLPQETQNRYIPDIDWDATKAIRLVDPSSSHSFSSSSLFTTTWTKNASGIFPSKGYVCGWGKVSHVPNFSTNQFHHCFSQMSIGANNGFDATNTNPQDIINSTSPLPAFPRDLIDLYGFGTGYTQAYSFTTCLFQVEANTSWSIWSKYVTSGTATSVTPLTSNDYIDIFFIPLT